MKAYIVIFLGIFTSSLFSQSKANFSVGPKVGVNFANINDSNTDSKLGLILGLTSTYSISEQSGLGLDLLYTQQGYKSGNTKVNLNYMKVPILYKLFFNKLGNPFRPRIEVGISPGFLVSAKSGASDVKSAYNSFEMGIVGGLGFNYRLGSRTWLNVDLRSDLGLTDLRANGGTSTDGPKNRSIAINFGVAYGL